MMNARWGMKSGLWVIGAMWLLGSAQALALGECAKLTTLHIEETTIESATEVEAGIFKAPGLPNPLRNLPHFCRVTGVIKPEVRFEVWLPLAKWTARFEVVGNGGMALWRVRFVAEMLRQVQTPATWRQQARASIPAGPLVSRDWWRTSATEHCT
jgi:hypothetical protein